MVGPDSPSKMPRHSLCKMIRRGLRRILEYRIDKRKSVDKSGRPFGTHEQRCARKTSENKSRVRKMRAQNVRLYKMSEHRTSPGKMPSSRRSCQSLASATRLGARAARM